MPSCFLCGTNATVQPGSRGGHLVQCPACARYEISGTLEVTIAAPQWAARRHLLSGMTRASDAGDTKFLHLTTDNVEDLVAAARRPSNMIEILDNLLLLGAARTESFGSRVNFSPIDWPLVFARDVLEFESLLRGLAALGYWEVSSGLQGKITVSGWKRLQQIRETAHRSWQAFVAMWFDKKQMGDIFAAAIAPALRRSGYDPVRVDLLQHNDKIDDRIIAEIRRSGLVVADFTGCRGGVYFEAGFARGLGIPVIWTCREDFIGELHFDTRQLNHITWKGATDLQEQLYNRIAATMPVRAPLEV
jgi:hypothetical protein